MNSIDDIAREMLLYRSYPEIQRAQTAMRMQLVQFWEIPSGATVLEIGCGQGDLTAVLADAVGPHGHVLALDPARPEYGDPVSIGDSTAHLSKGKYAGIVEFNLNYEFLNHSDSLKEAGYDYVVLAHCTWYFDTLVVLRNILAAAHTWAPVLCISDWDLCPKSSDQFAHMLSVLLQGQVEAYRTNSDANVRSPYALSQLLELLPELGWREDAHACIECSELLDGSWEIGSCLSGLVKRAEVLKVPSRTLSLIKAGNAVLGEIAGQFGKKSLSSFAVRAASVAAAQQVGAADAASRRH